MGRRATHGHWVGGRPSPTYVSWQAMQRRCGVDAAYLDVTVCPQWMSSFAVFLSDLGPRPAGKTLDRINSRGNYEPGNCRWATPAEQADNRSASIPPDVAASVRELCVAGWRKDDVAAAFGVSRRTAFRLASAA